jgi:hypothetical protein
VYTEMKKNRRQTIADEVAQPLIAKEPPPPDTDANVVDLTHALIYVAAMQSIVAATIVQLVVVLLGCVAPGSATRTLCVGAAVGLALTRGDLYGKGPSILLGIVGPVAVLLPLVGLTLLQLEASAEHEEQSIDRNAEPVRAVASLVATALLMLAATIRSLFPRSPPGGDVIAAVLAVAFLLTLHPHLQTIESMAEPLSTCASFWDAGLRLARTATFATTVAVVALCGLPDGAIENPGSHALAAAAAAAWIATAPVRLLPIALLQIVATIARRGGAWGALDAAGDGGACAGHAPATVACLSRCVDLAMGAVASLRACRVPRAPRPPRFNGTAKAKATPPPPRPTTPSVSVIDWTVPEQQRLLDFAAARLSGTEHALGDAILNMGGADPRECNPYAARTYARLQHAIERERGARA